MKKDTQVCPKCGKKVKAGKFCPECGASLATAPTRAISVSAPSVPLAIAVVLPAIIALVVIIGAIALGYLFLSGYFQAPTNLVADLSFPASACNEAFTYSIELNDANGNPLANQPVNIYVNDSLFEKLSTDQNGRISYEKKVPSEWCGKSINLTIAYNGDSFHKPASSSSVSTIFIPTTLQVTVPSEVIAKEGANITVTLKNSIDGSVLGNKQLVVSNSLNEMARTDANGRAVIQIVYSEAGNKNVKVMFGGDSSYSPSESQTFEINVLPRTCEDGTLVGDCSTKSIGSLCNDSKMLVFDCSVCGCSSGLVCHKGTCITKEEQTTELVADLQQSVVYVEHSFASGSGVVIAQEGGKTIILTNRHVVEGADSVNDLSIKTDDGKSAHADAIRVAPNDMDFAVIYVTGTYGKLVSFNYSEPYSKGQEVLALGSPLGLQGSVSDGIISNFMEEYTDSNYKYTTIQTDAAINPGNSGGGLFLKSSGTLIGINTFILTDTEGLNFAIELKELQRLSNYDSWSSFVPAPKCVDGTPYGYCSSFVGLYCSNGDLIDYCQECGCDSEYPNCATTGPSAGTCFSCNPGYEGYADGNCCRTGWDYYGDGVCCPPGYSAYDDGTCCAPGYEYATEGICCPEGTTYGWDGQCHY